jgi:predicted transcriptional regulator
MTDCIGKCELTRTIIDKVKELIKSSTYKTSFLEKEAREIANETALRQMDQLDLDEQIEVEHEVGTESEGQEEPCSSKNSERSWKQVRAATTLKKILSDQVEYNSYNVEQCLRESGDY